MKKIQFSNRVILYSIAGAILLISIFLRFYHLASIQEKIFDEVYFPVFAHDYLTQTDFFDVHPPLGKLIIAAGIYLFGNEPFGWRIVGAIAGVVLLVAVFGFAYELRKRWEIALLALFLVAIEPMALVESRVGLINIYLALFSILGFWFFWRWWSNNKKKPLNFALAILFMGMATSVKWIGAGAFAAAAVFLILQRFAFKKNEVVIPFSYLGILLIAPVVYLVSFIPDLIQTTQGAYNYLVWWHENSYFYHATLTATHPYGSEWWSWAIMLRPVWMYYVTPTSQSVIGIIEIGNVVTWIGGLFALVYVMAKTLNSPKSKTNEALLYLVLIYLVLYLPWMLIDRVKFIYHYFVPAIILLILLSIVLDEQVLKHKKYKWVGIVFILAATIFFLYFLPLLIGYPISSDFYQQHMWLRSWI